MAVMEGAMVLITAAPPLRTLRGRLSPAGEAHYTHLCAGPAPQEEGPEWKGGPVFATILPTEESLTTTSTNPPRRFNRDFGGTTFQSERDDSNGGILNLYR